MHNGKNKHSFGIFKCRWAMHTYRVSQCPCMADETKTSLPSHFWWSLEVHWHKSATCWSSPALLLLGTNKYRQVETLICTNDNQSVLV
jgi:hypothetical protein